MKVVFMGTPDFAVYSLEALCKHHEVLAVVSQPDRPKGRGKKMVETPVKAYAVSQGLEVLQPERARTPEFVEQLKALEPDLIAVTAYGQILSEEILNIPKYGCINVHGSLLPKYRGAAPMQWSIIDGDKVTGITTMYMAKGMDTGDMLLTTEIEILPDDNFEAVHDKMAQSGADLLIETMVALENGTAVRIPQKEEEATYAPMLNKETGHIDWTKSGDAIRNLMRGLDPAPGAYSNYGEEVLKLYKAKVVEDTTDCPCGTIVAVAKKSFTVKCGGGALEILELQAKGGKRMAADAYLRGHEMHVGDILQ